MKAPEIQPLISIPHQVAKSQIFSNGCGLHWLEGGSQEVAKIEWIWEHQPIEGIAAWEKDLVQKMQFEGSESYSRKQISELLDFYGIYSQFEGWMNYTSLVWHGLTRNLPSLVDVLFDVQLKPTFPETEWKTLQQAEIQSFHLSCERVNNLARRLFNQHLFSNHPYGLTISENGIREMDTQRLHHIHSKLFKKPFHVFVSGKNIGELVEMIGEKMEVLSLEKNENKDILPISYKKELLFQEKMGAQQNCIRIGRLAVGRNHEDFHGFQVLNTIIGGYFGSRLMKNLREDKGLTYGIGSMSYPFFEQSMFFINAEVKATEAQLALDEIQKELMILQKELISEEELNLVISTMQGQMIQGCDGIFAHMDRNKNIILNQLSSDYYQSFFEKLNGIRPEEIQELSQKYLNWDDLLRVNIGLRN
jgi:predicted Zn-dependent peptidase